MTHIPDYYGDVHRKYHRMALWFAVKWIIGLVLIVSGGLWVLDQFGK